MKVKWFSYTLALSALVMAGCWESDCGVDSMCLVDTVVIDTAVSDDGITDTTVSDVLSDAIEPDIRDDIAQDTHQPVDATDATGPDTAASECATDYDCEGCESCVVEGGLGKCVDATIYAGVKECYADDDCGDGRVCHYYPIGRAACGGRCGNAASYALHEWGVNVVTIGGGAKMSATPERFYGAIVAKPVIYIYSDDEFELDVRVDYSSGISYETWPVVPNDDTVAWEGIQVATGECVPTATPQPDMTSMEEVPPLEIYELPEWVVPDANCLTFGETVSKLLFYTGPFVGYTPPINADISVDSDLDQAKITITNNIGTTVGPLFALYRWTESSCMDPSYCPVHTANIGWLKIDSLPTGGPGVYDLDYFEIHVDATEENPYPTVEPLLPDGWTALPGQLRTTLIDKGLTAAEADVFMDAWTQSMFGLLGEDAYWYNQTYLNGGFLIYTWPETRVQEMLPLTAVPAPTTTARVLVEYQQVTVQTPVID